MSKEEPKNGLSIQPTEHSGYDEETVRLERSGRRIAHGLFVFRYIVRILTILSS
jgi:hypothetical protein